MVRLDRLLLFLPASLPSRPTPFNTNAASGLEMLAQHDPRPIMYSDFTAIYHRGSLQGMSICPLTREPKQR